MHFAGWLRAMSCHVMASHAMPGHIFACHAIFLRVMPCHKYSMSCRINIFYLGPNKHVFTGGLPPPRPPAVPGGASGLPLAGGLQPPAAPRRFLGGSASQALRFLVPRSWRQDLGTTSWYQDLGTIIFRTSIKYFPEPVITERTSIKTII